MRSIGRRPGFAALVIVTFAIAIGATTTATNVAATVLLSALPVKDESSLLLITKTLPDGGALVPFSYAELHAWREATRTLDGIAGVQYDGAWPSPAQLDARATVVTGTAVSGNFFEVLGVEPAAGRLLGANDARSGAEPVVVIGHALWRREFGGSDSTVGSRIRLDGRPVTIVGIAPAGFSFPDDADVWRPLDIAPDTLGEGWFSLIARVRPDATPPQAVQETAILLERLRAIAPKGGPPDLRAVARPLKETIVGDARPVLVLFAAAAGLLFAVGCLNVANLLLVRGMARERELATRAALGATRVRLVRELLAETSTLAAAGGVLGAAVAFWVQRALVATDPAGVPRLEQLGFDLRIVSLAAFGSLLAFAIAGVGPALWTVRRDLFGRLRSDVLGSESGCAQRQALIALQLAFAFVVTVAASLLVRSLWQLQRAELGFAPDKLTVLHVPLVGSEYRDAARRRQFFEELVSRMDALPDIAAATPVLLRPFTGKDGWDATFTAEGQPQERVSANPAVHLEAILPNYFATLGIPIRRGRGFTDADRDGSPNVVIVPESLARRLWPEASALGQRLKFGGPDSTAPWMAVVGTVGDVRYRDLDAPPPAIYVPVRQMSFPPRFLVVRATVESAPILAMAQRVVRDLDADEPVAEAMRVMDLLGREMAGPRFHVLALGTFAAIAVVLAAVGVFAVLAASVGQRSRELGLRIALGATRRDLTSLVMRTLAWPLAMAMVLGTAVALGTTRMLQPLLFDVSAIDARAFAAALMVLILASLCASLVPLRRAVQADPVRLLRSD